MNCRSIKRALIRAGGWEGHKPLETATMLSKGMEARGIQTEIENHWEILADAKALRNADSHYEERVCPMPVAWVREWGTGRVFLFGSRARSVRVRRISSCP